MTLVELVNPVTLDLKWKEIVVLRMKMSLMTLIVLNGLMEYVLSVHLVLSSLKMENVNSSTYFVRHMMIEMVHV